MAALNNAQKRFIVERLACFDTPHEVAGAFKEEFGFVVSKQQLQAYDPKNAAAIKLSQELRDLFAATRERFKTDTEGVPIANKMVRLRMLQGMIAQAGERKNLVLQAALIEQAAKESGDAYTNRQKIDHTSSDGSMTPNRGKSLEEFYKDAGVDVPAKPGA